jgi:hypothetical protein
MYGVQAHRQQQDEAKESAFKPSCAPLCLINGIQHLTQDLPVQDIISHVFIIGFQPRRRNRSIVSVLGALVSVLLTPTLFFLEIFDMAVEFVQILSLRLELLFELTETELE